MQQTNHSYKTPLSSFLAQNPFPRPFTQGFFYREKMRAIHQVTPDHPYLSVLEVGGGKSGLSAMLFPKAQITNLDLDPTYANSALNQQSRIRFICGDATQLPFDDETFDAVTMFDVLEHIPDDQMAIQEAFRVLKPEGYLLVSTPNENWQFPYYSFMKCICPQDLDVMAEWGHVRRGYSLSELEKLMQSSCQASATFINPVTVLAHDLAFSYLPAIIKELISLLLGPITWLGYSLHQPTTKGTETAYCWQKSARHQVVRSQAETDYVLH